MEERRINWKWRFTKDELPKENKACVIWIPKRPWELDKVGSGIFYKVAWLVRGISLKERESMKESERRKHIYRPEDEYGNNQVSFYWETFGPDSYFGQEVIAWTYIEEVEL